MLFLGISLNGYSQVCELILDEFVTVEFANFSITKITDNGSDCTLDYTLDYKVINQDACGVNFQSVVLTGSGSQTTFVMNTDMNWHTTTGKLYNTVCNGNADIRVSGGWGYPCSYKGIAWPGVTCQSVSYAVNNLPVELTSFRAKRNGAYVELNWSTSTEVDNEMFVLEHSTNGIDFNKVTEIEGAGNSIVDQYYSFLHENPSKGNNYYRLKQIDFDGDYEYSDVELIWIEGYAEIIVYPNPTIGEINFKTETEMNILSYGIYNQFGKLVQQGQDISSDDSILIYSEIPNGNYFLELKTEQGTFIKRILYHTGTK